MFITCSVVLIDPLVRRYRQRESSMVAILGIKIFRLTYFQFLNLATEISLLVVILYAFLMLQHGSNL